MSRFLRHAVVFLWLLHFLPAPAVCETPQVQIQEALAGLNGDSRIQCIGLAFLGPADAAWGAQSGETGGRLVLIFEDAAGTETGRYVLPANAPVGPADAHGLHSVLVATGEFAAAPGAPAPNFTLPGPLLAPGGGRVTLAANPANPVWSLRLSLAYGNYARDPGADAGDPPTPAGPPAPRLAITGVSTLQRFQGFDALGTAQRNGDFRIGTAACRNSAGVTATFAPAALATVGRTVFFQETFGGNGRTCGTCHLDEGTFSLPPEVVPTLNGVPAPSNPRGLPVIPLSDPLFVFERVAALAGLEDPVKLRGGRGLVLENIDGFDHPAVFRASPALLNLRHTGPFGLSAEFDDLGDFSAGAVVQHFPRTLGRNANPAAGPLDFREASKDELEAMVAFMFSIETSTNLDLLLSSALRRGVSRELLLRGKKNFFGDGKCFKCHGGPTFSDVDASLVAAGVVPGPGNRSFNTGVARFSMVRDLPGPHELEREFNVRSLLGAARRRFFFHDNSVEGIEKAIAFYCTNCDEDPFARSPAFAAIGHIVPDEDGLKAFLEALVEPLSSCVGGPGRLDCDANGIADDCEIALYPERDCNGDGVRDSCQPEVLDCDRDGIADSCQLALNPSLDCNSNHVPDSCDIQSGSSPDCNLSGVPDECEQGELVERYPPGSAATFRGAQRDGYLGFGVAAAGDFNDDGLGDVLVGDLRQVFTIFGRRGPAPDLLFDPTQLNAADGFLLAGIGQPFSSRPLATAPAGDLNGDGVDDFLVGDPDAGNGGNPQGKAYAVLGRAGLGSPGGPVPPGPADHFTFLGTASRDWAGWSVAAIGDLSGDGLPEILVGAPFNDARGNISGEAYVIFGGAGIRAGVTLTPAGLDGRNGFTVRSRAAGDNAGSTVASVGDVNGDGRADFLIASRGASPGGRTAAGEAAVIYGRPGLGSAGSIDLASLDGTNGFRILGADPFVSFLDLAASSPGDLDGDGKSDLLYGRTRVHVILRGAASAPSGELDLSSPPGDYGLVIEGIVPSGPDTLYQAHCGPAGDLNADGFPDIWVASSGGGPVHVIFGGPRLPRSGVLNVSSLDPRTGLTFPTPTAPTGLGPVASGAGDFNGDGLADFLIGLPATAVVDTPLVGQARLVLGPPYPADCNANGIPDSCEVASGAATDADENGVPDVCQPGTDLHRHFRRGDANGDGAIDISDAVGMLLALFAAAAPSPPCDDAADANDDGFRDISDAVFFLEALFRGGGPPPAPHPGCGEDPTPDGLTCEDGAACAGAWSASAPSAAAPLNPGFFRRISSRCRG